MGSRIFIITAAFLVLLSPSSAQVCTDFGKDIEGAAVDKKGNFFAVNGKDWGLFCTLQPPEYF